MTYSFDVSTLLRSNVAVDDLLGKIITVGAQLDGMIDLAAKSAILLAHNERNVAPINRLVASMPNGTRVAALKKYLYIFAPIKLNEDKKNKEAVFLLDDTRLVDDFEADVANAYGYTLMIGTNWTDAKPPKADTSVFDKLAKKLDGIKLSAEDAVALTDAEALQIHAKLSALLALVSR